MFNVDHTHSFALTPITRTNLVSPQTCVYVNTNSPSHTITNAAQKFTHNNHTHSQNHSLAHGAMATDEMCSLRKAFDAANLPALVLKIMRGIFSPVSDTYVQNHPTHVYPCHAIHRALTSHAIHRALTLMRVLNTDPVEVHTINHENNSKDNKNVKMTSVADPCFKWYCLSFAPLSRSCRYSQQLKDLILSVLHQDPQQRPTLDQILTLPVCQNALVNLHTDIGRLPCFGSSGGE